MGFLLSLYTNRLLVFLLVLTRVSGLVSLAPMWSSRAIPVRVRALLALGIAVIVAPLFWHVPLEDPGNLLDLGVGWRASLAVGVGARAGGHDVFLPGWSWPGRSWADVWHELGRSGPPRFGHKRARILAVPAHADAGRVRPHRWASVRAAHVRATLRHMPPAKRGSHSRCWRLSRKSPVTAFRWGLQLAAPMMAALLLTMLIMGLISRTVPQLNVLAVGFGSMPW